MRVRRGLLFWGLFLIPLGALPLLVRAGIIDGNRLVDAWRLWPLILIGAGLALVLGRTRTAVLGTVIIALVLGTLGGAALASGNLWIGAFSDCAIGGGTLDQQLDRSGTFANAGAVQIDLRCGTLNVNPATGSDWTVHAAYRGTAPTVDATDSRLTLRVPSGVDQRQEWTVGAPTSATRSIDLTANAASATLALAGMQLDRLEADINAGDLHVDASTATVSQVNLSINAGRIRLATGSTALNGDLSVNAGAIDLCVPDGVALRFDVTDQLTFVNNLANRGLSRSGNVWTRGGAGGPVIDLSIDGNAAALTLNPEGGCR